MVLFTQHGFNTCIYTTATNPTGKQSPKTHKGGRASTLHHVGFKWRRLWAGDVKNDILFLVQYILPVVELNGIRTLETALGKGMFTLFHGSPAMFSWIKISGSEPANQRSNGYNVIEMGVAFPFFPFVLRQLQIYTFIKSQQLSKTKSLLLC